VTRKQAKGMKTNTNTVPLPTKIIKT